MQRLLNSLQKGSILGEQKKGSASLQAKTAPEEQEAPDQHQNQPKTPDNEYYLLKLNSPLLELRKRSTQDMMLAKIGVQQEQEKPLPVIPEKKIKEKEQKAVNTKRWTAQQDKLYVKFLEENAHLFRYKTVRRVRQIFILLSDKMGGRRTPAQCKSHHQKMRNATVKGTIKQIIAYVKQKNYIREQFHPPVHKAQEHQLYSIFTNKTSNGFEIKLRLDEKFVSFW